MGDTLNSDGFQEALEMFLILGSIALRLKTMLQHYHVIWGGSFSRCSFTASDNLVDEPSYLEEQSVLFCFKEISKHWVLVFPGVSWDSFNLTWVLYMAGDLQLSYTQAPPTFLLNSSTDGLKMNNLVWFNSLLPDIIQLTGQQTILSTLRLENMCKWFRIKAWKCQEMGNYTENTHLFKFASCGDGGFLNQAESSASCKEWQRARGSTIRKYRQQHGPC